MGGSQPRSAAIKPGGEATSPVPSARKEYPGKVHTGRRKGSKHGVQVTRLYSCHDAKEHFPMFSNFTGHFTDQRICLLHLPAEKFPIQENEFTTTFVKEDNKQCI